MKVCRLFLIYFFIINGFTFTHAQVITRRGETEKVSNDSVRHAPKPDADRDDIPFLEYKPATIWMKTDETVNDYAYIRKNFTDQLISVWNHPRRYYPASMTYAISVDGNYYRSGKVSKDNYVFAQQMVKGNLNLYLYRIIPQTNGWVEMVSSDKNHPGYRNNMIIEVKGMRGSWKRFGYFVTQGADTLKLTKVDVGKMKEFAATYLEDTPQSKAIALKYTKNSQTKVARIAVFGIMAAAITGTIMADDNNKYFFLATIPLAAVVAIVFKSKNLHWEDMVNIAETHNRELKEK
jgi:hypothetical protein